MMIFAGALILATFAIVRWFSICRHPYRLKARNAAGKLELVCDRCGDRVPAHISELKPEQRLSPRIWKRKGGSMIPRSIEGRCQVVSIDERRKANAR